MKKALAFLFALIFLFGLSIPAAAAAPKAAVIRIQLVEGTVSIKDASGVAIKFSPDMKLFSGYSVETGDNSCAYINLDDEKAIKLDMNTTVTIKKSGNKLKVDLKAGQLIFNVTAPLAGDESLEIRTSTMVTGIRGSSGGVNAETGEIFYGTGHGIVWFRETDRTSSFYGLPQRTELWGGRIVSVNWPVKDMELSDFPALFLGEVAENPDLQNSLEMEGKYDPQLMIEMAPLALEKEAAAREEAKSGMVPLPDSAADNSGNGDNVDPAFIQSEDLPANATPQHIIDRNESVIPNPPWNPDEPDTTAYTIIWADENGDILEEDKNVPVGTFPEFNGAEPTKAADAQYTYTFAGWSPEVSDVTGDETYTATYSTTTNTYTITWKDENGTVLETDENVAYGSTPSFDAETPAKTADAQYTYTFAGWSPEVSDVTGDETYTATYSTTTNTYTITWKQDDGNLINTTIVAYGEVPAHDDPTKTADAQYTYTFAGWDSEPAAVTGDAAYTATYSSTINSYTITWKQDDGSVIDTTTVEYGAVPSHADPARDADAQYTYTFAGWNTTPVAVTGDATYTATYSTTTNTYTITWKQDDGSEIDTTTVAYGEVPTLADPVKAADAQYTYSFAGWDPDPVAVTGDAAYTATYDSTVNTYTITWKQDDGNLINTTIVAYGEVPAHDDPTKTADAQYTYSFAGWDPDPVAVTGDAAYTATYDSTVNKYTVSFIDDDGVTNLIEPALYEYGTPAADIIEPYMTTKDSGSEDYKFYFDAWDTEITEVKGDATYQATYYKKYRITFEMNGHGSAMDDIWVKEGEYAAPPDTPTDAEYEFIGWYSDQELTVPFDFENTVITEAKTLYAKWRVILVGADPMVTVSVPAEMEPYVAITVYDESDNPYDNPSPIAEGTTVYVSLEVDPDYYFIGPKTSLVAEAGETAILATGLMEDDNYSLIAYTVTADDTTITVKNLYQVIDALDNTNPLTMDSVIRTAVTATDVEIDHDLYIDREGLLVVNSGVEVAESATVTIDGRLSAQSDAVNNGTIINNHQFDIAEAGTYSNTGSITNNGIMEINGGVLNNAGDINNYGTLNNNGYLYSNENTINNNGTLLNTDMLFIGSDSGDSTLNNLAGARLISEGLITIRESSALENYGLFFAGGDGLDDLYGGYTNHNAEGEATYGGYCSDDLGWLVFETAPDTYILYITGDGAMEDFDTTTKLPPWIEFLPGITAVRFYAGITRLGNYAFYNEGSLISATFEGDPPQLPDTPSSVFAGSDGAFTVYYPSSNPQWAEVVSGGTWGGYPADAGA